LGLQHPTIDRRSIATATQRSGGVRATVTAVLCDAAVEENADAGSDDDGGDDDDDDDNNDDDDDGEPRARAGAGAGRDVNRPKLLVLR